MMHEKQEDITTTASDILATMIEDLVLRSSQEKNYAKSAIASAEQYERDASCHDKFADGERIKAIRMKEQAAEHLRISAKLYKKAQILKRCRLIEQQPIETGIDDVA